MAGGFGSVGSATIKAKSYFSRPFRTVTVFITGVS
jgi:hypothetical protein